MPPAEDTILNQISKSYFIRKGGEAETLHSYSPADC